MKKTLMVFGFMIFAMNLVMEDPLAGLSFLAYAIMQYQIIYRKSKIGHWIVAISAFMLLANTYILSVPDMIFWGFVIYANKEVL